MAKTTRTGTISFNRDQIPSVTDGKSPAMDFTQALMRGDPVAERLIRESGIDPKEVLVAPPLAKEKKESLADLFMSGTYEWAKEFNYTAKDIKAITPILLAYRKSIREASRFTLEDDATRYITEISSTTPPEKLFYRLQFATLPYPTTWIEFNNRAKVRIMRELKGLEGVPVDVSDRAGILLERVDDTMVTCTMVVEGVNTFTSPLFHGYLLTLDERVHPHNRTFNGMTPFSLHYRINRLMNDPYWKDLKENDAQLILDQLAFGAPWGYSGKGQGDGTVTGVGDLLASVSVPDLLKRHAEVAFTRFYDFFELARKTNIKVMQKLADIINQEIAEFTGMLRWIVTALAVLNEIPTRMTHHEPVHQVRAGLTKRLPAFDYHMVTLRVPKTKPVGYIQRKLSNIERRHRAHEVRGHWRTYVNERPCPREEHAWETDWENGYRLCGKCESFSRFIREHVRGDRALGWVHKSYIVKKEQQQ